MASQASTRAPTTGATSRTRNKTLAPAAYQKQLQTVIAVHCITWVHTLDQMKLSQVQQKLFDSYHGNPVQALLPAVKECLSGNQGFDSLWDRGEENSSLTLKSSMTQKDDVLYTSGTSFNQLSLSTAHQSTQVLIDGRAIYSLATTALKNGKKALSVELSAYKDGKLPSGWNDEDLDKFILDGMWTMLTGAPVYDPDNEGQENVDDVVAAADDDAQDGQTSERPESWIFSGWCAYRLFGPRAHADFQSPLFEVGDWVKNKRGSDGGGGRTEQRKALAEQTNTIRLNSVDRGVPVGASKKDFVQIAQAESRADQRTHECNVLALTQVVESKQKRVGALTKLLEIPGMEGDQKSRILEKVMELMEEIERDEKVLQENAQNKRLKSNIVESFLLLGGGINTTPPAAQALPVTPHNLSLS